jgi:DNA-binding MarR family transcriptional regulator
MTQLVGRLERDGLVVRLIDPDDGRATLVDITDGQRAVPRAVTPTGTRRRRLSSAASGAEHRRRDDRGGHTGRA